MPEKQNITDISDFLIRFRDERNWDQFHNSKDLAIALSIDAAHIIADSFDEGIPIVPNGLSLCKIHHAAFDKNIIGISPDYQVSIREDILAEVDGPMLKYGIQSLDKSHILLPRNPIERPDRDRLSERFDEFMRAG